jgi:hypothetical protein
MRFHADFPVRPRDCQGQTVSALNHGSKRGDFTDISDITRVMMRGAGCRPEPTIEDGIRDLVAWYRDDNKFEMP